MKKQYDVCGLGNAILDILMQVSDKEFDALNLKRGSATLVDKDAQHALLSKFRHQTPRLVSGGSVANSIATISQLGGKPALICCVADDNYGLHYRSELEALGVAMSNDLLVGKTTGTSVILITPDAERTMSTCLAVSTELDPSHVDKEIIERSKWLFIEGYLFLNPAGVDAIKFAVKYARACDTKIALTLSDAFVIDFKKDEVLETIKECDLIFCNEGEALALSGCKLGEEAIKYISKALPSAVVTQGAKGAWLWYQNELLHVPAIPCEPVDLTGAGDALAGTFLFGVSRGENPIKALSAGCRIAKEVISHIGARLSGDLRPFWDEAAN